MKTEEKSPRKQLEDLLPSLRGKLNEVDFIGMQKVYNLTAKESREKSRDLVLESLNAYTGIAELVSEYTNNPEKQELFLKAINLARKIYDKEPADQISYKETTAQGTIIRKL